MKTGLSTPLKQNPLGAKFVVPALPGVAVVVIQRSATKASLPGVETVEIDIGAVTFPKLSVAITPYALTKLDEN